MSVIETEIMSFAFASKQNMAILKIVLDERMPEAIKIQYTNHINKHNSQVLNDPYPNSGFDLLVPNDVEFTGGSPANPFETVFINHMIKCEMFYKCNEHVKFKPSPFDMVPRSSISKTPLMMANHIGIIDSGYRGDLLAAVRCFSYPYKIQQNTRLFQICHPSRCPIYVKIVNLLDLTSTARGEGGFGSTGV